MSCAATMMLVASLFVNADPAVSSKAPDLKKEAAAVHGAWTVESAMAGKSELGFFKGVKLNLSEGDKAVMVFPNVKAEGTFKIDPAKSPKEIDLTFKKPDGTNDTMQGIYQFKEGKLLMLFGAGEASTKNGKTVVTKQPTRPKNFDDAGPVLLFTYTRDKK